MVALSAQTPPVQHVLVFAKEFQLNPSRTHVLAGRVVFQLRNIGEDDHDLSVEPASAPLGMPPYKTTGIVHSGGLGTLRLTMRPGRYRLFCSVATHAQQGMQVIFTVRARKAAR
jgi:uncharacterized cupredoxin-like copper-binding protein